MRAQEHSPNLGSEAKMIGEVNDYILLEEIGSGSQSVVYRARCRSTGDLVAVKALVGRSLSKKRSLMGSDGYKVKNELAVLKLLNHRNLVKLIEVIDDEESDVLYIVMDYVNGRPILDEASVMSKSSLVFPEQEARRLFKQLVSAICYLHHNRILHKDIKPQNILLEETDGPRKSVKLCDFGVATFSSQSKGEKILGLDDLTEPDGGTVFFFPPEALQSSYLQRYNGRPADVWSAGVTLYCLIFGKLPFHSRFEIISKKIELPKNSPRGETLSNDLIDLLSKLLEKSPEKRSTIQMVSKHSWLAGIDLNLKKVNPDLIAIEKAVTASRRSLWSLGVSEKIRKLRIANDLSNTITRRIEPALDSFQDELNDIKRILGVPDLITDEAEVTEIIENQPDDSQAIEEHFRFLFEGDVTKDNREEAMASLLNQDFLDALSERLTSLQMINDFDTQIKITRNLLRLINNFFPMVFSVSSRTSSSSVLVDAKTQIELRDAQRLELQSFHLSASHKFDKIFRSLKPLLDATNPSQNDEVTIRENRRKQKLQNRLGDDVVSHKYSQKAIWLLGHDLLRSNNPSQLRLLNKEISIVIIGGGYAGMECAKKLDKILFRRLEDEVAFNISFHKSTDTSDRKGRIRKIIRSMKFKLTIVERRESFVHKMSCIRGAVLGNHFSHRCLIPNATVLSHGEIIQAAITSIDTNAKKLGIRFDCFVKGQADHVMPQRTISYDYLVCASGTSNLSPASVPSRCTTRSEMSQWFDQVASAIENSSHVAVVGSGPVAAEFCGEIKHRHSHKMVTFVIEKKKFLLRADPDLTLDFSDLCLKSLEAMGVILVDDCILSTDVNKPNIVSFDKLTAVQTVSGGRIMCDLIIFCKGSVLNNSCYPASWLDSKGQIKVSAALQVVGEDNVFAAGDISNAEPERFKRVDAAIKQGSLVAKNIVSLICKEKLTSYNFNPRTKKIATNSSSSSLILSFGPQKGVCFVSGRSHGHRLTSQLKGKTLQIPETWKYFNQEDTLQDEVKVDAFALVKSRIKAVSDRLDAQEGQISRLRNHVNSPVPSLSPMRLASANVNITNSLPLESFPEDVDQPMLLAQINKMVDLYNRESKENEDTRRLKLGFE